MDREGVPVNGTRFRGSAITVGYRRGVIRRAGDGPACLSFSV